MSNEKDSWDAPAPETGVSLRDVAHWIGMIENAVYNNSPIDKGVLDRLVAFRYDVMKDENRDVIALVTSETSTRIRYKDKWWIRADLVKKLEDKTMNVSTPETRSGPLKCFGCGHFKDGRCSLMLPVAGMCDQFKLRDSPAPVFWCSACRNAWTDGEHGWSYLAVVGDITANELCPKCDNKHRDSPVPCPNCGGKGRYPDVDGDEVECECQIPKNAGATEFPPYWYHGEWFYRRDDVDEMTIRLHKERDNVLEQFKDALTGGIEKIKERDQLRDKLDRIHRALLLHDAVCDDVDDPDDLNETELKILDETWDVILKESSDEDDE